LLQNFPSKNFVEKTFFSSLEIISFSCCNIFCSGGA
jgi:hypothetical protein